jgi:hypothetical protein
MPNPPPPWIKFLQNASPYLNVIDEIAVNNEGPAQLQSDCHRYFSNATSVCLWIGIKVLSAGGKFWVGWAERAPGGNRARIHSDMRFPPHHHPVDMPVNVVLGFLCNQIYRTGITMSPNSPPTLDIDCDTVRLIIQEFL